MIGPTLGIAYLLLLVIGLVLSFATSRRTRRRVFRIATIILASPMLVGIVLLALLRLTVFREPPNLQELQHDFRAKRAELDAIVRMSDYDAKFSRIAPDFLDRASDNPNEFGGRFMRGDRAAGLPDTRWNLYREIFARSGIKLGLQRDRFGDAFIMVDSVGLINRGHTTGYLYCRPDPVDDGYRFQPCVLRQERGQRDYDPQTRGEAYSFLKLDASWYAYDEGPS